MIQLTPEQYSRLEELHLNFNLPEPAIVCTRCGYALAVDGDRVGRHLGKEHQVPKHKRRKINSLINSLQLPNPESLPQRPDNSAPHPHLQKQQGAACRHCGLRSTSETVFKQHIRSYHRREITATKRAGKHWLRDHITDYLEFQSWRLKDIKRSWIVSSQPAPEKARRSRLLHPALESIQLFADQLLVEERKRLGLQPSIQATTGDASTTPALLTNWMRRTGWDQTFEYAQWDILTSLSCLPSSSEQAFHLGIHKGQVLSSSAVDERKPRFIVMALDGMFDCCAETARYTDVSIRRWLRGCFPDRPYKAPFELVSRPSSERIYRNEFKRCICFWLRLWRLPRSVARSITGRAFSSLQHSMLKELWLDPCWTRSEEQEEDKEDKVNGEDRGKALTAWLEEQDSNVPGDTGYQEDEEESDEEDEDVFDLSNDGDTASDTSYVEDMSDEHIPANSMGWRTSQSTDEDPNDLNLKSHQTQDKHQENRTDNSVDTLLRFYYKMAIEEFEDGKSSSTLLVYFSAVRGISSHKGNKFMRPSQYIPILSRLIYCTRLVFLEAILPRHTHPYTGFPARPRYSQLVALNTVRTERMCDGTMLPLGEFLSLLAYGSALRRSEGPVYHFHWSEDGQTISWDRKTHLSINQFRSLAHEAFRQATIQSRRLMYDYEPEDLNLGGLRDRLSESSPGYSFITDPQNELEEL